MDDSFSDLGLDLFYKQEERMFEWRLDGGFSLLSNNWYGLSEEIDYSDSVIEAIDEKQKYTEIELGAGLNFYESLIHTGNFTYRSFFDKFDSAEMFASVEAVIDFPIGQELMYSEISFDFLDGKFKNDFFQTEELKYTYFNIGFSPNFEILRENLTLNVGARLYYSITNDFEGSKFYAYPNITASYNISDEALIAYAGVIGDLDQNSYKDFVDENPFVSHTLFIQRTNQQ